MMTFLIECLRMAVALAGLVWMAAVGLLGGWVLCKVWKLVWRES